MPLSLSEAREVPGWSREERRRRVDDIIAAVRDRTIDDGIRSEVAHALFGAAENRIPELADLFFEVERSLRSSVVNAILRQDLLADDPEGDAAIRRVLFDGWDNQRGLVLMAVGRRGAPQDLALLRECADSGEPVIANLAQEILQKLSSGRRYRQGSPSRR